MNLVPVSRIYARPVRSPTIRANEKASRPGINGVHRTLPVEKWPTPLLEHILASSLAFPGRNIKDLIAILDDVEALNPFQAKEQTERVCNEHNVKSNHLLFLATQLKKYNEVKYRHITNLLETCALKFKGESSAFFIVQSAISTGRLQEPQLAGALKSVKEYADQGLPKAVILQGRIFEHQLKPKQALKFYQEWAEVYAEACLSPPFSESMDKLELAHICKAIARLRIRFGDRAGAEQAIRDAALVYDDPEAYYHLAVDYTASTSQDFESYLTKAAASGLSDAAYELALFYLNKPSLTKKGNLDNRATATEWFSVAAESGITPAQIYLALLLRLAGHPDQGLDCLQSASTSKSKAEWAGVIDYLKQIWRLPDTPADLTQMDLKSLRASRRDTGIRTTSSGIMNHGIKLPNESYQRGPITAVEPRT
ncbi:MAG: hypothetical protein Q9170_006462 [Blastenia crenularia]